MSKVFARLLNAATAPFDLINYAGPCGAAKVYGPRRMGAAIDRVIASLHRHLEAETEPGLARGMHYPVRWDPFFKDFMTLGDIYRYPTQHFDFHRRQLTLGKLCGQVDRVAVPLTPLEVRGGAGPLRGVRIGDAQCDVERLVAGGSRVRG
ncbi:hypothetical protein [Streptomyces sp. NBC_01408]|uniref:hypothetical protein n=1 Tax=Streptomyces sp. NBC_01408 TaxID=2903855 RepID=UPI002257808A|nr:hypothetical protein [Streptomyces sp. NBC_01408]MCX4695476.1 DinB family protein [Streptomyces sp. NBC_01408]